MITLGNDGFHMTVTTYHTADNPEILCCGKLKKILTAADLRFLFQTRTPSFTGL